MLFNTKQEIFDHVYDWFITQDKPYSGNGRRCYYFHPEIEGAKCAVGCLIPDKFKEDFLPYNSLSSRDSTVADLLEKHGIVSPNEGRFLIALQGIHDNCAGSYGKDKFAESLALLANEYNLECT